MTADRFEPDPQRFATHRRLTPTVPAVEPGAVTGARLEPEPGRADRLAHGGLRRRGWYKAHDPDRPLVTIVTVCRNAAATLEAALQSVFEQSYDNIEYIVVDGASTDGTLEILQRHGDAIDCFVSEPDRGLYEAMNKGLALATGEHLLLLNADDRYVPTAVEELVRARRYAGTDVVSALAEATEPSDGRTATMRSMPQDDSVRLRMPLRHETMLVPAAAYREVGGYDTSYAVSADWLLTVRLYEAGYTHYEVPRPLLQFSKAGVSNTDLSRLMAERERILSTLFPYLSSEEVTLLAQRDTHEGAALLALCDRHSGQEALRRAIHAYVADNALNVKRRDRPQWSVRGPELLARLHALRMAWRPKVSVVMAVYKARDTLRASIDSVLAQTLSDFELICVNDCSPDDSQAIVDAAAAADPRIVAVMNPRNVGHGATRNVGVQRARGAYVFHIDPDDSIPPHALQVLYDAATRHGSELVRGAYRREQFHHGRAGATTQVLHPLKEPKTVVNARVADLPELLRMPEGHWAFLYQAELARRVPYPEDLKMGQDAIFLCSVLPAARSITIIPEVVYHYLANAESAMNVFSVRKYLDVLEWRRRALHMLADHGLRELGVRLLRTYANLGWHDQFVRHFGQQRKRDELVQLGRALRQAYAEAGLTDIDPGTAPHRRHFLGHLLSGDEAAAEAAIVEQLRAGPPAAARPAAPPAAAVGGGAPVVSVVLPFHRAEDTLRACIDSVLAQTLTAFELVCINDTSPDGSQAIVDEYRQRDPRVVSLRNETNLGHGASRNRGVAAARGEFVFHVDPDDTVPPQALERLVAHARTWGSDMVKGAYLHEQVVLGAAARRQPERRGLRPGDAPIVNTTLAETPSLLASTEGHWSYLYRTEFARQVPYPTDLKMGQDSIFIVDALTRARRVSVVSDVVYRYHANASSAMNSFDRRKFLDAVEWRRRAWHRLSDAGLKDIADRLLLRYWTDAFFHRLATTLAPDEAREVLGRLRQALAEARFDAQARPADRRAGLLQLVALARDDEALARMREDPQSPPQPHRAKSAATPAPGRDGRPLRVVTLVSRDHGGAGIGTLRRVEALRREGVDATVHALVKRSTLPFVHGIDIGSGAGTEAPWAEVQRLAVKPVTDLPGYRAREFFSLHHGVVDFRRLKPLLDRADVVHLHWVVGLLDLEHLGEVLGDKPVVWTLADMNAFTGGCHYAEDCDGFERECRRCPQLGGDSDLAHRTWRAKREAYAGLRNLHIVCPSQWMADRVRRSTLLGGRPVHHVPNAFPLGRLKPVNRLVARLRLGLPAERRLVLFGAENLGNPRKGGALLQQALRRLRQGGALDGVEAVVFGNQAIDLPLPVHALGSLAQDQRLALAYSAADVFVLPSLEDNAPLTVGEALLCGTPVVAFPVGNVPEVLAHMDTGYTARMSDAADLAQGLRWALRASPLEALNRSLRCRSSAARFHDPALAAQRHIDIYREAMSHA